MNTQIFELVPTNGRKNFGNKAKVIVENNIAKLLSYNTIVAEYDIKNCIFSVNGIMFSKTTTIHINTFREFYGFDTMTKKEMEKSVSV